MLQVELSRQNGGYHTVLVQDVHDALRDAVAAATATEAAAATAAAACSDTTAAASSDTTTAAALDLILSADTFIYVGQLDLCFELSERALRTNGLFAFSIELLANAHVHSTDDTAATASSASDSSSSSLHSSRSATDNSSGSSSVIETVGFKLVQTGRYAHTEQYIEQLAIAHSFAVAVKTAITVRTEAAQPIAGYIYVLCKD
jgi:predicted TPR repeat methyltransferase